MKTEDFMTLAALFMALTMAIGGLVTKLLNLSVIGSGAGIGITFINIANYYREKWRTT